MKARETVHAMATSWVAGIMTVTGVLSVAHAKSMMEGFAHLGYPAYFANLLGVAKLLGVCALLAPRLPRIKEWAYVGVVIPLPVESRRARCFLFLNQYKPYSLTGRKIPLPVEFHD